MRFGASHDVDVSVSYGSSGTFYAQLLNQAPFDMFLSADVAYPNQLAARGLTLPQSEFTYAIGRIVVWAPAASPLDVEREGLQALTQASVAHIAIANPEHAPYGRAAVAAMQSAGVYDRLQAEAGGRRERRADDAVRAERRGRRRHRRAVAGAGAQR